VRPPSVAGQVRWRLAATRAKATLTTVGLDVATGATVAELRPSERVLLAVARALIDLPETGGFLFLDEPTAGLDEREARELLEHVRGLAQSTGVGVVLVTHRLRDVERFADDVTVLRDGRVVERMTRDDLDLERIVVALGGRLDPAAADSARRVEPTVGASQDGLVLRRVSGHAIRDLTVTVAPGEVIGFTGLEGSGKDEIIDLLYGVTAPRRGSMSFDGAPLVAKGPAAAVRRGIGLVPADRVGAGGIPEMTIQENLFLSGVGEFVRFGTFRRGAARRTAAEALSRYHVVPDDPAAVFASLSGGNQQKVIVGRWLRRDLRLLLLHEPTAGVDVGARTFLWSEIREAARRGVTVVVATSDIAEAAELCDRVAVLVDGRLTAVLAGAERTPDRVLAASLGETESTAATDSHGSP
jgi:ribose transport system ATP-binding protein